MKERSSLHARIHYVVSKIPRGRVATYGQIARLAGQDGGGSSKADAQQIFTFAVFGLS